MSEGERVGKKGTGEKSARDANGSVLVLLLTELN